MDLTPATFLGPLAPTATPSTKLTFMSRSPLALALLAPTLAAAQNLTGLITESHAPTTSIRGAVIRIKQRGATRLAAELETGNDGRFSLPIPLPAEDYRIEISKPGHASATFLIRLPATTPINVALFRYGTITGRVTDYENRPLPGASVITMVVAEEDPTQFRPAPHVPVARVDNAGNYRIFDLAPGRYALAVTWASMASGGRQAPIVALIFFQPARSLKSSPSPAAPPSPASTSCFQGNRTTP